MHGFASTSQACVGVDSYFSLFFLIGPLFRPQLTAISQKFDRIRTMTFEEQLVHLGCTASYYPVLLVVSTTKSRTTSASQLVIHKWEMLLVGGICLRCRDQESRLLQLIYIYIFVSLQCTNHLKPCLFSRIMFHLFKVKCLLVLVQCLL